LKVTTALQDGIPGFTPHTFRIEKTITEIEFLVSILCGIEDCGCYSTIEMRQGYKWKVFHFYEEKKEFQKFSFARWYALINLQKNGFALDYKV
jgi:hypothetical protein